MPAWARVADDWLAGCELCPRRCRANRRGGDRGFCRAGAVAEVYRYGRHDGEEPPVSGTRGSGTVFFSRCTLRCGYCQNYRWSQAGEGAPYGAEALARILGELRAAGCHNWNLVSPTPWLPQAAEALAAAAGSGPRLPVVYNTSGYERVEVLRAFAPLADVYLTDLRYADPATAAEASGARDYVEVARAALTEMAALKGPLDCDGEGVARAGVICRLLILPGHADEAVANLEWIAATLGTGVAISVMAQYHPVYRAAEAMGAPWNRRVSREEHARVGAAVDRLGFETGWVQELAGEPPGGLLGCDMAAGPDRRLRP